MSIAQAVTAQLERFYSEPSVANPVAAAGICDGFSWNLSSYYPGDQRLWCMYELWLRHQHTHDHLPVWSLDIVPELGPWLPDMFEVKFTDAGACLSRFGSGLVRTFGVDLSGRHLGGGLLGPGSERLESDCQKVRATGQVIWSDDELRRRGAAPVVCERLLLPFADAEGRVSRVVGCLFLQGLGLAPGWLGTITRFITVRSTMLD
ncbi:PAS domain-containing protein [Skermanella mucosa]|uniref:PAS domain-containing protein n=1 Tax=Skermanella mucosa TaxID=1789672 RepID=UPI00192CC0E6|nr:PAS domain-containing protein [Skermanella mucosa]UEM19458.1 PAS domain-containing protein [Skermanella mucosa]